MFWHKYPYTNFHELNLDWVIQVVKDLNDGMDDLLQQAIDQATENAKEYVDSQLSTLESEFEIIQRGFNDLTDKVEGLDTLVEQYTTNVNAQIAALRAYVDDSLEADRLQMQLLISQNNDYLLSQMTTYLAQVKVINFFTGELVSIQDMFNYLASLHLNDSIDYDTMAARSKTYSYLAGLNINYTNLAMHGNTLYV